MTIDVTPVRTMRDRRAFVDLPFRLHASHRQWAPPLRVERHLFLSRRTNSFFRHGEGELLLARRGDRVVGRISAHVDHAFCAHHGSRWGWFGFLEVEEDEEAIRALVDAAAGWLRDRGCDRMVGPASFTLNDECGVLVEGFDEDVVVRQPWNPPSLPALCEAAGLRKAIDMLFWTVTIGDREDRMLPVLEQLGRAAREEHGIRIRRMSQRSLRRDLDRFAEVYNVAWARNWGFVPYSKEDLDAYARELRLVFDPRWFMVAERDGETVAVAITVPDVNPALRAVGDGRLLPLGWWRFLRARGDYDRVRIGFLGVKPEFQHTGVAAALYLEHFETSAAHPRNPVGHAGWILETNKPMNRGMEAMGARVDKRYRMYERELTDREDPGTAAGRVERR